MLEILLVVQLVVAALLVGVILLQRSEGGALGMGGGDNPFMSVRGKANFLTRTTAILAALFMGIGLLLAILASQSTTPDSLGDILESAPAPATTTTPPPTTTTEPTTPSSPSAPLQ